MVHLPSMFRVPVQALGAIPRPYVTQMTFRLLAGLVSHSYCPGSFPIYNSLPSVSCARLKESSCQYQISLPRIKSVLVTPHTF